MTIKYEDLPVELKWNEDQQAKRADKLIGVKPVNISNKKEGVKPDLVRPKYDFNKLTKNQTQPIVAYMKVGTERTNARVFFPCINGVGCTVHPITGQVSAHRGVDITTDYGKHQFAVGVPGEGKVEVTCKWQAGGAGNYASMYQPGTNVESIAMHLSQCNFPLNKKVLVEPGSPIGTSGSTGMSTAVHAHLGVLINGSYINPPLWTGTMLINGAMPSP